MTNETNDMNKKNFNQYNITHYESIRTELDNDNQSVVIINDVEVPNRKNIPAFQSKLRSRIVEVPEEIYEASGTCWGWWRNHHWFKKC